MPPRPEAHGFTKFILSIGVFLCVAAFVVPALILRDTDVLRVSEQELAGLTPLAENEIRDRQETARDLGGIALYIGTVFLGGGLALLWYGLPRLRQQEDKDEVRASMELDKLQSELQPQSEEEEQAELAATVEEDAGSASPVAGATSPPSSQVASHKDRINRAREIEDRVLERLAEIAPPRYELRSRVKVPGTPSLLVDGILVSPLDQLPDILIDIKLGGASLPRNLRNRLAETLLRLTSYKNRIGRQTMGWLIMVIDEPLSAAVHDQVVGRLADLGGELHVTTIGPEEISRLALPVK